MSATPVPSLDLSAPRPRGLLAVDASAGTGKTYALVAMAVRALAVGEVRPDELLVMTFTRAATVELRDRLREGLRTALDGVVTDAPADGWIVALRGDDAGERAARTDRLRTALLDLDRATVTTLHGYCRTALDLIGLRSGGPAPRLVADQRALVRDVVRDAMLVRLLDDPDAPAALALGEGTPDTLEGHLHRVVKDLLAAAGSRPAPLGRSDSVAADATAALAAGTVAELRRRLATDGSAGFDDLVLGLHARLHAADGDLVAGILRARHRLVLVDEHQDTDAVQWAVIRRAFLDGLGGGTGAMPDAPPADVVIVGDPKQSIYRFRGADVAAYLAARAEAATLRALGRSHRAAPPLVAALNVLLAGVRLGEGIEHVPVAAARPPDPAGPATALEVRWLPDHEDAWRGRSQGLLLEPAVGPRVLADVADRVVAALGAATLPDGAGGRRCPLPRDIAVLVRNNAQARRVVAALERAGVPAAQPRGGSVYDSTAVGHLRTLLAALAAPDDERLVRALLASWFLHAPLDLLADEGLLATTRARMDGWRRELEVRGLLPLWARLRGEPDVAVALALAGERGITDLEHLCELVHVALDDRGATPQAALRALDELRLTRPIDDDAGDDPGVRRLASDGSAVQVMTLHTAKGLEWPVVLLPFGGVSVSSGRPYAFGGPAGRIVDAASWVPWRPADADADHPDATHADPTARRDAAKAEEVGDESRLLYVGLTRAREQLVVWWVPTANARGSRLHELLFGERTEDGDLEDPPAVPKLAVLTRAETRRRLAGLADRVRTAGGTADVVEIPAVAAGSRVTADDDAPSLEGASTARLSRQVTDPTLGRWSYSRLTAASTARGAGSGAGAVAGPGPADGATAALGAGADPEADPDASEPAGTEDRGDVASPEEPAGGGPLDRIGAGGRWFGVLVHGALEQVDPAGPDLVGRLRAHLAGRLPPRSEVDPTALAEALAAALATPLDPVLPGRSLGDVPAGDRLAELRFDLALGDTRRPIDLERLGARVGEALGDDPLAPSLRDLGRRFGRSRVAGWLTGSIDLLVRVAGDGGTVRHVVIDHKTDVVRDAAGRRRYDASALHGAVRDGDYALQLLLYQVAAHRLLRRRLVGYDPAQHLGGAALLYLRGLGGPDAPLVDGAREGVLAWRPDPAVIVMADELLGGGPVHGRPRDGGARP